MKGKTRLLLIIIAAVVVVSVTVVTIVVVSNNAEKNKHPDTLSGPIEATLSVRINTSMWTVAKPLLKLIPGVSPYMTLVDAGINVANNLTIRGVWDGNDVQLGLKLKDQDLVSASVRNDGNQLLVASEILPANSLASLSGQELGYLTGTSLPLDTLYNLDLSPGDLATVESAVKDAAARFNDRLGEKTGAEERGTWDFEGHKFGVRMPVTASTREIGLLLMESAQEALSSGKVAAMLKRFGVDPSGVNLEYQIENLKNSPDEYYPGLTAYRYRDGDSAYTEIEFSQGGRQYVIRFGTIGLTTYIRFRNSETNEGISLVADSRGYNYDFTASLSLQTLSGAVASSGYGGSSGISGFLSGSGSKYGASGFGFGPDDTSMVHLKAFGTTSQSGERQGKITFQAAGFDLVTLEYGIRHAGSLSPLFETSGKRLLDYNELTSEDFSNWLASTGAVGFLIRVVNIMPEAAAAVIEAITGFAKQLISFF